MAELTLDRSKLIRALERVRGSVAKSKLVTLYRCFCFKNDLVYAWNGIAGAVTSCPMDGMDFAIDADLFSKHLRHLFAEVTISLTPKKLKVVSGGNRSYISFIPTRGFPEFIPENTEIFCQAGNLVQGLKKIAFSIGTNALKPELMGITIYKEFLYASDGKRITRFKLDFPSHGEPVSLTSASVEQICKLGQPDLMFRSGGQVGVILKSSKTSFVTQALGSRLPYETIDSLLTETKEEFTTEFPETLAATVERVQVFSPPDDTDIILTNINGTLVVSAKTSEVGEAQEELSWEFPTPFRFAVQPNLLKASLDKTRKVDLSDVIEGKGRFIHFTDTDFDNILALMVLKE